MQGTRRKVSIVEVGPRDGFQSVPEFVPTEIKLEIIKGLVDSGIQKIQATSFISPKAIPQMRDAQKIVESVLTRYPQVQWFALVPNLRGADDAVAAGLREIAVVMSLSESHNMNNVKRSCAQSLDEIQRIRDKHPDVIINQDIACTFGCPFEGQLPIDNLLDLIRKLKEIGINRYNLCDTVGMAWPTQVEFVFQRVRQEFPDEIFDVHIHDTRNMGMINSLTALNNGAASVQTAIGGLGGCPFAPGASGNTATEDLVYMLERCGFDTGIDFEKLIQTARTTKQKVVGNYSGHHINIPERPCVLRQA